jgi:hypothetical protein
MVDASSRHLVPPHLSLAAHTVTHHYYTCFQPGALRMQRRICLGARQARYHQAASDH